MAITRPGLVGKRLMPHVIDYLGQNHPDKAFCATPKNTLTVADGYCNLTFGNIAHVVNYTAWWIEAKYGRSDNHDTITFIGVNDVRYLAIIMACNKTGYKPLLSSTRNSGDAHLSLFDATNCSRFVYTAERSQKADELQNLRPSLEMHELPTLEEMLGTKAAPYPFTKTFDEVKCNTAFIIHSSGTTGTPKPVYISFGYLGALDTIPYQPIPSGRATGMPYILGQGDYIFATTPFFHLMGITVFLLSIMHDVPFVLAPEKPMSADLATEVLSTTKPSAALFPPSILEDMTKSSASMKALSDLKYVFYAGAPLSPDAGNKIIEHTRLVNWIGSSEAGYLPTLLPENKEDWMYFEWNPFYGIEMQPVGDGYSELVIKRPANTDCHAIFHTMSDSDDYHTKDLFAPHPTRPNMWKYVGRYDDVLVLSNGEKLNPITMEKIIEGHNLVSRALVVGQSRFQTALLIDPNWDQWSQDMSVREFIERIWSTVKKANQAGPAHGRIMKNKIGIASQSKPFKTTPKGSTKRRQTVEDYAEDIDMIYADTESEGVGFELPEDADLPSITMYLRSIVSRLLESSSLTDQTDFYAAGLDSLQTMQLSNLLRGALQSQRSFNGTHSISTQDVYSNPTVELLSRLMHGIIHGSVESGMSRVEKINALLEKYTNGLPEQALDVQHSSDSHAVILTGSTGSLGNYLLHALIHDPTVSKVYCLNRSEAQARQIQSFIEKGLDLGSSMETKVEFLQSSFGATQFGLSDAKYTEMLGTVDTIIHNAWRVDFNITVDSYEDVHIQSVRRFIDFSLKSTHHAHFHFVSSVATIGSWKPIHGPVVPSEPIEDIDVVLPQGYGESKHIGERICLAASRHSGVPTTIHRVGQVAGSTMEKGLWNRQEWVPTIVATSKSLGLAPETLGSTPVDWIPVDSLASIISDLVATRRETATDTRCAVFNLVNPSVASWHALLPAVQARYNVQPVPFVEWIASLEKIENPSSDDIASMPALKLLDFYRGLAGSNGGALSVPIDVVRAKESSVTMDFLAPISGDMMRNWLNQWGF